MLIRYKLYDRQTNISGGQSWTRTQQRRIASRTRSTPGHATSYLSYYYDLLFLAGGHFDATKEKRPLDTKKVSAFVYNTHLTHERIIFKTFCRLSLSKKFLLLFVCWWAVSGARGQKVKACPRGYCRQIAGFFGRNGRLSAIIRCYN